MNKNKKSENKSLIQPQEQEEEISGKQLRKVEEILQKEIEKAPAAQTKRKCDL